MAPSQLAQQLADVLGTLLAHEQAEKLYTEEYERALTALKDERNEAIMWVPVSTAGWIILMALFAAVGILAYTVWWPGRFVVPFLCAGAFAASLVYSVHTRGNRRERIKEAKEHNTRIETAFDVHKQALDESPTGIVLEAKQTAAGLKAEVEAIARWFPPAYLKPDVLHVLLTYAANQRVSTLSEAINLYETERFRQDLIDTQEDIIAANVAQINQLTATNANLQAQLNELQREVKKLRTKK